MNSSNLSNQSPIHYSPITIIFKNIKMKRLQIISLTIFSIAFLLTSCGGDDASPIGADAGAGKLTATVDGQSWKSKDTDNGAVYAESQGTHTIHAYHDDGSYIALTILTSISPGSTIDGSGGLFQAQYKPDFEAAQSFSSVFTQGGTASITFTVFSESKVKGTFEFTGTMVNPDGTTTELEVKNGSFEFDL